jgi:transcriptional regulator with XRE-family HTH domain
VFSNLGRGLIQARELRGLSPDQLAARSGVPLARLLDYEAGRKVIRLEPLGRLLAALDISPFQFFSLLQPAEATTDRVLDREGLHAAISAAVMNLAALYRAALEEGLRSAPPELRPTAPKSRVARARRSARPPRG